MTKVIALTGGIGSGKSTASALFAELGVPVIDADVICTRANPAREQSAFKAIVGHFGDTVVKPNGELDRASPRKRIFEDPTAKLALEHILHPLIHPDIIRQINSIKPPYCLVVIPL